MALSCLVYFAEMKADIDPVDMQQFKENTTRQRSHSRISGALFMANGYLFEIMEGEYATLETNLDQVSSSGIINDEPEIFIFSTISKQQFQSWKMGVLESELPINTDLTNFKSLSEQALSDPQSVPKTALLMLKQFSEQFAPKEQDSAKAA